MHLYAQVALPTHMWVAHVNPDASPLPSPNAPRVLNLEGLAARLRLYIGGSFIQLLNRQSAFEA